MLRRISSPRLVRKADVPKFDGAAGAAGRGRCGRVGDLGLAVEHREDALGGRHRRLEDVELLGEVLHGLVKALDVLEEGHEAAEAQRPADDLHAAVAEQQRHGQRPDELDDREEDRVGLHGAEEGLAVLVVDACKARRRRALAREELDDVDAAQVLVEIGVHPRHLLADGAEGAAHPAAEEDRRAEEQRQHREGDEREPPVDGEHRGDDADHGEQVAEDRDRPAGEELLEHLDVAADARHQPAGGVAVEVRERLGLDPVENRQAQVHHGALADAVGQQRLSVPQGETRQRGRDEEQRRRGRVRPGPRR